MNISTQTLSDYPFAKPGSLRVSCIATANALVLPDGTRVCLRPMTPEDRDRFARLFEKLSFESRRMRFLVTKPELTPRELAFLTDIDHVGHEAIVAVDQHDGSIVGVARYVRFPGRAGVADLAAEVADDLQGMGLGTELAKRVVRRASTNGFTLLTATTLWENRAARALLKRLQFRTRASHDGQIELELELEPASDCSPANPNSIRPHRCAVI